uniref:uncharacterized protein LOC105349776 n=1 Tax=Fragaria vesca subsp. vesca TaxID=101020 RepID=UPI0005CAED80|nr:PREDICTED: uncharacterized protein LOC105349776 [Fragaria vesca subsp. vesca]
MAATMDFNGFSRKRFFKRFLEIATFYAIKPRRKSPQKSEIEDRCDLPHELEKIEIRDWSDLPCELLSLVAEYASLIELQSFCRVCKAWNSAYSTVLPQKLETEVNKAGPWFLLYDYKNPKCQVLTGSGIVLRMASSVPTRMCFHVFLSLFFLSKNRPSTVPRLGTH